MAAYVAWRDHFWTTISDQVRLLGLTGAFAGERLSKDTDLGRRLEGILVYIMHLARISCWCFANLDIGAKI